MELSQNIKMIVCCLMKCVRKNYTKKRRRLAKKHERLKKKGSKRKKKLKNQKRPPQKLKQICLLTSQFQLLMLKLKFKVKQLSL